MEVYTTRQLLCFVYFPQGHRSSNMSHILKVLIGPVISGRFSHSVVRKQQHSDASTFKAPWACLSLRDDENMSYCRHADGDQYPVVNITVHWEDLGYETDSKAAVRDLFATENLGVFEGSLTVSVDLHDARMVKITPEKRKSHHEDWRPWGRKAEGVLQVA